MTQKRIDLLKQRICPIHKVELDLVFAGHGGSEYWCQKPGCWLGARFAENGDFQEISRRKNARGQK